MGMADRSADYTDPDGLNCALLGRGLGRHLPLRAEDAAPILVLSDRHATFHAHAHTLGRGFRAEELLEEGHGFWIRKTVRVGSRLAYGDFEDADSHRFARIEPMTPAPSYGAAVGGLRAADNRVGAPYPLAARSAAAAPRHIQSRIQIRVNSR